ncbi:MAG: hypothetical protein ACRDTQ_20695 [Micromonosporaceae bacterium]
MRLAEQSQHALRQWIADNDVRVIDAMLAKIDDHRFLEWVAARSYQHANGFVKIVLAEAGARLRLHRWSAPTASVAGDGRSGTGPGNVHSHRWCFASSVVLGSLVNETFVPGGQPSGREHSEGFEAYTYRPGGSVEEITHQGPRTVSVASTAVLAAGSHFSLHHFTLHRAWAEVFPTYTLIVQGRPVSADTQVLAPPGKLARREDAAALTAYDVRAELSRFEALVAGA